MVIAAAPGLAATPKPQLPDPESPWTKPTKVAAPATPAGTTKAPASQAEAKPPAEVAAWRAAQKTRTTGEQTAKASGARSAAAASTDYLPEGQGEVPWHRIVDTRLNDALVARVNLSNGNLMLAATDFDIAGVGQKLQLARTYNSLEAPWGKVSQRWWQAYERYLQVNDGEVDVFDATGNLLRFTARADGTYITPAGYSKDLKKNADGTYALTDRKSGTKDTYSEHGTLLRVTDKNKGTITVDQHDEGGEHKGFKLTETRSGRWIDLVKTYPNQWQAKDHTGRTAVLDLDDAGNLAKVTDTNGKATTYEYDGSRRVTKVTTPEDTVTLFTYDGHNRVRSMQRATESTSAGHTGPTWRYDYTAATPADAGTTTVTDPDGDATKYVHTADGEVTKVTDPLGHARHSTYKNRLTQTAIDAMGTGADGTGGNTTTYGWDGRNNAVSQKLPLGATASVSAYQTVAGTDLPNDFTTADGRKDSFKYDTNGNTMSVTTSGTAGGTREYTYNDADPECGGFEGQRCTAKDAGGKVTSFEYDTKGNLRKVKPPAPLGETTYTYDALGRLETVKDGRNITTVYAYDNRDRVREVSSTNSTVTYTYDGDGNVKTRTDASGTTTWEYDKLNREKRRTLQNGAQTVLAYTPGGDVDYYTDPTGTTDYTWDTAGRLDYLTAPDGKKTDFEYNNNDKRTKTVYPGGTTQSVTIDKNGRPEKIKTTSGTQTFIDLAYSYKNTAGKDTTKIRTRTDNTTKYTTSYTYDSQDRLTYALEADGAGTRKASWLYCFDKAGNLTSQVGSKNACPGGTTYTYNDASQLTARNGVTTGWSYDKLGNETAAASTTARTGESWTDYSQLAGITADGKTYDLVHAGTSNAERTKLGSTWFHHTALGLASTSTNGVDTGFIREPAGTLNSMTTGGKSYYYLTDATGNVLGLADNTGKRTHTYAYGPTGLPRTTPTESVPQPYRYAGAYADPTGLYKMGHRYYDPTLGRFTQPDPSGQEQNAYLYAEGDFASRTDATGLASQCVKDVGTFGASVLGTASAAVTSPFTFGAGLGVAGGTLGGVVTGSNVRSSCPNWVSASGFDVAKASKASPFGFLRSLF
ncbi:RHS repeat-associated core domain-containing protein [Streptomyces olivaceus]|uniref:RHS repeat-associated core domain-containing protein n=1 Tax=Streptomyces olivaceus TaxID=47716 RepID=UPI001CCE01A3|nr:RHS repeat-associated core domain-containing protein [Streptomyces olivaceus]MBZ6142517.1 RHS repeat protein [Streptomyces olivaceus]MBZ6170114.1 RHS repeat protein [Streptomyces olivaceus]